MKKLLLALIFAPIFCHAQILLGHTLSYIKSKQSNKLEVKTMENGVVLATMQTDKGYFGFYFDDSNTCNLETFFPETIGGVNAIIESYNRQYVILGERKWKAYLDDGTIMLIMCEYVDKLNRYAFYYKEAE